MTSQGICCYGCKTVAAAAAAVVSSSTDQVVLLNSLIRSQLLTHVSLPAAPPPASA